MIWPLNSYKSSAKVRKNLEAKTSHKTKIQNMSAKKVNNQEKEEQKGKGRTDKKKDPSLRLKT